MSLSLSNSVGVFLQAFTNGGTPLSGGLLYTFAAGTSVPQATFSDSIGTPNPNPIVLDSAGRLPGASEIWLTDSIAYRLELRDSLNNVLKSQDNVVGTGTGALAAPGGSAIIGFQQAGADAVARTLQSKERDIISVEDFRTAGDDTATIAAALASGAANVLIPPFAYSIGHLTAATPGQKIFAHGATLTMKNAVNLAMLTLSGAGVEVWGGTWDGNKANQVDAAGFTAVGIVATAANCSVRNTTVQNTKGYGIGSLSVSGFSAENNRVLNPGANGISCEATTATANDLKIRGNYIDCNNADVLAGAGCISVIGLPAGGAVYFQRGVISDNILFARAASHMSGLTLRGDKFSVTGNRLVGGELGYSFTDANFCDIRGNYAENYTIRGIELAAGNGVQAIPCGNNAVVGNVLTSTTATAIGISASGGAGSLTQFCSIVGNTITGGQIGIAAQYVTPGDFSKNTISGNIVNGLLDSVNGQGIRLTKGTENTITGNVLRYGSTPVGSTVGVFLNESPQNNITGNIIEGFQVPVAASSAAALVYTDLVYSDNTILGHNGAAPGAFGLTVSGTATLGARNLFGPNSMTAYVSADNGNADVVLSYLAAQVQVFASPITVDRTLTLPLVNVISGRVFRVLRKPSATGAFNINVGVGPLKALSVPGSFCDVEFDGTVWFLTAYGTL